MAQKKKLIIGNWKMNPATSALAALIFKKIQKGTADLTKAQAIICPPYVYLETLSRLEPSSKKVTKKKIAKLPVKNSAKVLLGAQNLNPEPLGARTGEISGELLKQFNVNYVIIGHSERRDLGETDAVVNTKVLAALGWKFKPILCIGEKIRDDDGHYLGFIKSQLEQALAGVKKEQLGSLTIAYEPIWAIGATTAMAPSSVHEMTIFIRKTLFDLYKSRTISTSILYGGSVDTTNAEEILRQGGADGLLIGRQSLDPEAFTAIAAVANTIS